MGYADTCEAMKKCKADFMKDHPGDLAMLKAALMAAHYTFGGLVVPNE